MTTKRKWPAEPVSMEPVDWAMHCDMLQEMGAPGRLWRRSRRIYEQLAHDPRMYFLALNAGYYPRVVACPRAVMPAPAFAGRYVLPDGSLRPFDGWGAQPVWVQPRHVDFLVWSIDRDIILWRAENNECLVTPDTIATAGRETAELWAWACKQWGEAEMVRQYFHVLGLTRLQRELDCRGLGPTAGYIPPAMMHEGGDDD